jgi:hypothetical protein
MAEPFGFIEIDTLESRLRSQLRVHPRGARCVANLLDRALRLYQERGIVDEGCGDLIPAPVGMEKPSPARVLVSTTSLRSPSPLSVPILRPTLRRSPSHRRPILRRAQRGYWLGVLRRRIWARYSR